MDIVRFGTPCKFEDVPPGALFVGDTHKQGARLFVKAFIDLGGGSRDYQCVLVGPSTDDYVQAGLLHPTTLQGSYVYELQRAKLVTSHKIDALDFSEKPVPGWVIVTDDSTYLRYQEDIRGKFGYVDLATGKIHAHLQGVPNVQVREWSVQIREGDEIIAELFSFSQPTEEKTSA